MHGANAENIFDAALRHPDITPVIAKHEFAAGAMADGAARISGGIGAVLTTSGGGALNVVPAPAEAYDSRVPVLALIGTAPRPTVGRRFPGHADPARHHRPHRGPRGGHRAYAVVDDPGFLAAAFTVVVTAPASRTTCGAGDPKDVQAAPARPVAPPRPLPPDSSPESNTWPPGSPNWSPTGATSASGQARRHPGPAFRNRSTPSPPRWGRRSSSTRWT